MYAIRSYYGSVSGVAEVNALGGNVKTYEVVPDLEKMRTLGITMQKLFDVLETNNRNDGAGSVTSGVETILVRSVGKLNDIDEIQNLPLASINGKIITISQVAKVQIGHLTRAGFVTKNGIGAF